MLIYYHWDVQIANVSSGYFTDVYGDKNCLPIDQRYGNIRWKLKLRDDHEQIFREASNTIEVSV